MFTSVLKGFNLVKSQIKVGADSFVNNGYATEASFKLTSFQLHLLKSGPKSQTVLKKVDALKYYTQMKTIRDMEKAAGKLYRDKLINGFCHLCSGQEAGNVGMRSAMRPKDMLISSYRIHGLTYLMGVPVSGVLAELVGRVGGCVRGKGGSMHMYTSYFYGGNGIVGSQVPLGTGLAFASQYKKEDAVTFALYGDGAANNGQIFESYNLAKLWNLPIVFVCENNLYAMGTSSERSTANINYYTRGDFIPGIWVNGMDVLEVREAARFAVEYIKAGNGPIVIEIKMYRYHGHSMSDPGTSYRSREEVAQVRKTHDPINVFKEKIIGAALVTNEELKKIDAAAKKEVDEAVKIAKASPEPPLEEMAADVYSMPIETDIRGVHPWHILKHKRISKPDNL